MTTVKQLKSMIENLPDDTEISLLASWYNGSEDDITFEEPKIVFAQYKGMTFSGGLYFDERLILYPEGRLEYVKSTFGTDLLKLEEI